MATIYGYKFNNYYNRKLKKYNNIEDYGPYEYIETSSYLNFNPNDGITTNGLEVFGSASNKYYGDCNYLIYSDDNVSITSRWFILEQVRVNEGKYKLTLRRDILADNLDKVLSADVFIEKAILPDANPLIYNSENFGVNQIKTDQIEIKDASRSPWIILYYDKKLAKDTDIKIIPKHDAVASTDNKEQWITNNTFKFINSDVDSIDFYINFGYLDQHFKRNIYDNFSYTDSNSSTLRGSFSSTINQSEFNKQQLYELFKTDFSQYKTQENYLNWISTYKDQVIEVTGEGYYQVNYTISAVHTDYNYIGVSSSLFSKLDELRIANTSYSGVANEESYQVDVDYYTLTPNLTKINYGDNILFTIPTAGINTLNDAPYNAIAFPYNWMELFYNNIGYFVGADKALNLQVATEAQKELDKACYGLEIVPFCPLPKGTYADQSVYYQDEKSQILINKVNNFTDKTVTGIAGVAYPLSTSSISNYIALENPIVVNNKKMSNTCDVYRLSSPDHSAVFEFSAAKNEGISGFRVDMTLLPNSTYINVSPDFKGLYGTNFKDSRGLVMSGGFSLAQVSDPWQNFVLNNRNYQIAFDRQIENMEFNNYYGRLQQSVGAGVSALATGATLGIVGGPIAGVATGVFSGLGGMADYSITKSLQNEAIDYTKDNFGYQLGNIKARPTTLMRTTSYNVDNTYFVTLEYYTCTDREKEAFAKKIAWNSMTVMEIGKIENYINNTWSYGDITSKGYIKGQLIRIDIDDDPHMANAIAEELNKGVYTDEYTTSN